MSFCKLVSNNKRVDRKLVPNNKQVQFKLVPKIHVYQTIADLKSRVGIKLSFVGEITRRLVYLWFMPMDELQSPLLENVAISTS